VLLDQEELDAVAPGRSRSLTIDRFVDLDDIDPIYYQKTYFLGPGGEDTAKVYGLLRDAMTDANRAAIGTLVMRGKEYLAAIRPDGDLLVLETMYFADEIRDAKKEIDPLPGRAKAKPAELAMAGQLIDSMSGPWKPADFRDTYTDRVNELIEAKRKGQEVTPSEPAPAATGAADLLDMLRQSVEAAKKGRGGGRTKGAATGSTKSAATGSTKSAATGSTKGSAKGSATGSAKKTTTGSAKKTTTASKKTTAGSKATTGAKKTTTAAKKTTGANKTTEAKKTTGARKTTAGKKSTAQKKTAAKKAVKRAA
jgi:DNA end-binding protein Ku